MKSHDTAEGIAGRQVVPAGAKQEATREAGSDAQAAVAGSPRVLAQQQAIATAFGPALQRRPADAEVDDRSGRLPGELRVGIESMSAMDLSDVRVHRGSDKPAQLGALAYAQGNEIHLGPMQEQQLPHEAWHVVQQRQGRVPQTLQVAGVPVNDDAWLEQEADAMGAQAASHGAAAAARATGEDTAHPHPQPAQRLALRLATPVRQLAARGVVQRQLTVDQIDFNPVTHQFRHGYVDQVGFLAALTLLSNRTPRYSLYRGQWNNVLGATRTAMNLGTGLHGTDVPALATAIADLMVQQYGARGLAAFAALQPRLEADVADLLATHLQQDLGQGVRMTPEEGGAYDVLRGIVGDAHMSRLKGTATQLPYASLPGTEKAGVDQVLGDLRTERALWRGIGIRSLPIACFLPAPNETFGTAILARQRARRYQGNHTNTAGWLPAVAAPANHVETQQAVIRAAAGVGLAAALDGDSPLADLGIVSGQQPNADGALFITAVIAARGAISNQQLVDSVGAALAQGVSGYVEFSMPGDISRLVYDTVNGHVYISAHYKWRAGYNPWFRVTGAPAV